VREKVTDGQVALKYLPTGEMVVDMMTKALPLKTFSKFRDTICV